MNGGMSDGKEDGEEGSLGGKEIGKKTERNINADGRKEEHVIEE